MNFSSGYDLAHAGDVTGVFAWISSQSSASGVGRAAELSAGHSSDVLNASVKDGYNLLHVACMFGQEELVAALLVRNVLVNINAENESRATPLHLASAFREEQVSVRIIDVLLNNGAELNSQQHGGQTALHHAVARGSVIISEALILGGADPFLKDETGLSPMDLAKNLSEEMKGEAVRAALKRAFSLPLET